MYVIRASFIGILAICLAGASSLTLAQQVATTPVSVWHKASGPNVVRACSLSRWCGVDGALVCSLSWRSGHDGAHE